MRFCMTGGEAGARCGHPERFLRRIWQRIGVWVVGSSGLHQIQCNSGNNSRSGCEAFEVVLASNLTPLPLASLNRGRDPQGSLGTVPWAGGTETAEGNWRETYKLRLAKRLARRLREDSSLRAPRRVFRHKQVRNNVLSSAAHLGAPHSAGNRSARLRLTLGVS
jgi:hypothetical protein